MGGVLDSDQTYKPMMPAKPTEEISEQYLNFQYPFIHLHLNDDWVRRKGTHGLMELWMWSTVDDGQMRTLHCVIDRWTLSIDDALQEFNSIMTTQKPVAGLINLNVYVHEFDKTIQYSDNQGPKSATAWRWFIHTNTTTSLAIHCDNYHNDQAERKWANEMITIFTCQTTKPVHIHLKVQGSTPEEIKQLVISYITNFKNLVHPHIVLDIHHLVPNPLELASDYETMHKAIQQFIAQNAYAKGIPGRFYTINTTQMKTFTNDVTL